ncbi:hypothetical protein COU54_04945 [Candidatus Pacearchaeota archaeon CG10_big_fil_rev_8_21_14_0_10_31_24]|nr:MAG: hypothetical protein COU54_04945 [Candidatus Pacearchaeota archaeon CG10_big_fil_rev_8_21_14_0_10_31_24]
MIFTAILIGIGFVSGAAEFEVISFSCTPGEVVINDVFSCTAQVRNTGDSAGSVSTATLYEDDGNDWIEGNDEDHTQASGVSVNPNNQIEITFNGLRATRTGVNGFSKILLDDVSDTYVADENIEINVIDVVVVASNSVSSVDMSDSFVVSADVSAGGSIDVELTFSVSSGGCSIGSQSSSKTLSNMDDGNSQSHTWNVTQGTSGDCEYSVSALATGDGSIATTLDTSSSSVDCSDCPTESSSSSSSSSSSGGGGGGASSTELDLGELLEIKTIDLGVGEISSFLINGESHTITIDSLTPTEIVFIVRSNPRTYSLIVGNEVGVDITGDGNNDVKIMLKSISIITNKAKIILTPLYEYIPKNVGDVQPSEEGSLDLNEENKGDKSDDIGVAEFFEESGNIIMWVLILIFVIVGALFVYPRIEKKISKNRWQRKVVVKRGKDIAVN